MPKTVKPGFCSDLHLRNRQGDEQYAFEQIVDAAVARMTHLFVAGDVLDCQTNRSSPIAFLYRQLDRLEEAGVEAYFIEGQHEWDNPPWFSGHRWAKTLHKQLVEIGEHTYYGLNFQSFGKLQEELAEVPASADFLICHQRWSNWMGEITAPQGEFAQIPANISRVYTGDLHQWKLETHRNAGGKKMVCCSTGATTQQKIDEPHEHYYAILDENGNFVRRRLKSRVFVACGVLNTTEDLDEFIATFEEQLATAVQRGAAADLPGNLLKPVMRVTYGHSIPDAPHRIDRVAAGRAFMRYKALLPEGKAQARAESVIASDAQGKPKKASGAGEAVTPLGMLAAEVDKETEPDVYELVSRLLQAGDQQAEFLKWKQEQMEA